MKRFFVNIVSGLIFIAPVVVLWVGASWAYNTLQPAEQQSIEAPQVTIAEPSESEPAVERFESVAAYFKAGNPNATTYRRGEPLIKRESFSAAERNQIHAENGGCCQVCGSTTELELEHRRGLQNGGGNERENLGTLCHDCQDRRSCQQS